jgi:hypothetical protein
MLKESGDYVLCYGVTCAPLFYVWATLAVTMFAVMLTPISHQKGRTRGVGGRIFYLKAKKKGFLT